MTIQRSLSTVLHVIAHMEKGGAERQLSLLVGASRHRHVIAVLPGNECPSPVVVELLPGLNPVAIYSSIRGIIRKHNVDIVQLWLPDRITIPAMLAAGREGCRIISGDRRRVRNYGLGAIRDRLTYVNHWAADVIIPNYPHLLPWWSLRRLMGIRSRTRTILNGIDLIPHERTMTTVPDRLLFVGRLVEQKRVAMLVSTMPLLMAEAGVKGLDIVGDGPKASDLAKQIEFLGLTEIVTLRGRRTDWGQIFDPSTHMFVLPSASEGMSNSLFEAIALGFFPIVSYSAELDTILEKWSERPVMIDHRDAKSLVTAICGVRQETGAALTTRLRAMQRQLSEFSVERMAETYDTVYDALKRDLVPQRTS